MAPMSPMEVAACAGSALLVLSAALPCLPAARLASTLTSLVLSVGLGAAAIHWFVDQGDYVSDDQGARLVKYGVVELRKEIKRPSDNLIVLDAGSYSAWGVDPKALKKELAKLGYKANVIQMSLPGGNHFERHEIWSEIFERQLPPKRSKKRNTLLLSEVQNTYDSMPLAQLLLHPDTSRAYAYMTPSNAWYALRSVVDDAVNDDQEADLSEEALLAWTALRHLLINAFNVGIAGRIAPLESVDPRSGYRQNATEKDFVYKGAAEVLDAALMPIESVTDPVPRWLIDVREARLKELWRNRYDHWLYYSVPSTKPPHVKWTRAFCRVASEPCIPVDDPTLIQELDRRSYWKDAGHLSTSGARVYTRWLAERLDREQVLTKAKESKGRGKARPADNR